MEGFDTMALPYLASPLSLGNMQGTDYLNALQGMDLPDQRSNFDSETFVRCVVLLFFCKACSLTGLFF